MIYTAVGGALVGAAGAAYSLNVKLGWSHRHTAGMGWIALAIVIFAGWHPVAVALGAYLFGALKSLGSLLQPMLPGRAHPGVPGGAVCADDSGAAGREPRLYRVGATSTGADWLRWCGRSCTAARLRRSAGVLSKAKASERLVPRNPALPTQRGPIFLLRLGYD